jgi:speckle-type POZ protein
LLGVAGAGCAEQVHVQIDDMDAMVFKTMLRFIYGDSLSLPTEAKGNEKWNDEEGVALLQHLLVAVVRYDLQRLREMCEKRMCDHISVILDVSPELFSSARASWARSESSSARWL